jgi:E3 ubiquitin-protein ligase HERC4
MSKKRIVFLESFKIFKELDKEFLNEIKTVCVIDSNAIIVTFDDKVFTIGNNEAGVLGFGNNTQINVLTLNEMLTNKQIIDFKYGRNHVIARTICGQVYGWGCNQFGVLGNGKNDCELYKPELIEYLSDKQIIDISCGAYHSLALSQSGDVFAWGSNSFGQIGNQLDHQRIGV